MSKVRRKVVIEEMLNVELGTVNIIPKGRRKKLIFEAAFVEGTDPLIYEEIDNYFQSIEGFYVDDHNSV